MKYLIEIEAIDTLEWIHIHEIKGFCINMGHRFYTQLKLRRAYYENWYGPPWFGARRFGVFR